MAEDYWQIQRVAAAHGMSVEAWLAHCDQIEARETSRRKVDRQMRAVPQYRDAA